MNEFKSFKEHLDKYNEIVLGFLAKVETEAIHSENSKLISLIHEERAIINEKLYLLEENSKAFLPVFQQAIKKRTIRLEKKIEELNKVKDTLTSDNFLLEYKKKDLLMLTSKLEQAYDEISQKNQELVQQKKMIEEQAEKLESVHAAILEKNEELEQQKESLLDQSDYLHEANQTILLMHAEVEKQKDEILKKNEELLSLNNEKNNLISIVAHDLKSPLNQIKGLLSIIKLSAKKLDDETLQYIEMAEKGTGKLTDMIGKILDVERIEAQDINIHSEEINLSRMLDSMAQQWCMSAKQKNISVHLNIKPSITITADRTYVEQVFENLVSNAIKFSPADKNIFINLNLTDDNAVLQVKDEGPGITESDMKKLFGKYQKLSAKPTGNETSTGLGLSIVKKFVEGMNGKIWCESVAGEGASFFVSFPVVK